MSNYDDVIPASPDIGQCSRRADELGMTYGKYIQSEQYLIDIADGGCFAGCVRANKKPPKRKKRKLQSGAGRLK
jgi:hypothetical protein|nr:MAG TPA: hypothetical protein [Caudoviricetes sp.]